MSDLQRFFSWAKISLLGFLATVFLFSGTLSPVHAQAAIWSGACVGPEGTQASDVATIQGLECLLANAFLAFFGLLGFASFIMIVVGSILILISGGSSKQVDTGKKTITFAIIGIVVSLSGFILINVLSAFTGVDLLQLKVPRATDTIETTE